MAAEAEDTTPSRPGLDRTPSSRRYPSTILLIAGVGIQLPLIAIIIYLIRLRPADSSPVLPVVLIAIAISVLGSVCLFLVARSQQMREAVAAEELRRARRDHQLEGRQRAPDLEPASLLIETRRTLDHFSTVIGLLELEAATDELTGMLNRRAGERRLREALVASEPTPNRLAVALLDVDGLKAVNDRWGHAAGDAALAHLASALVRHVGERGWIARWGGDEFLVVLTDVGEGLSAEHALAAAANEVSSAPLLVNAASEARLGVSWGVAWPTPDETTAAVIGRADAALYRAKQRLREATPG